jgi:HEPN domain-containing protein
MMETANLESVAERYRQGGYRVQFDPDPSLLPKEAKSLRPDFLASKGEEHVIVEVKSPQNLLAYPALLRLAEVIRKVPGWRLDVVVLEKPMPHVALEPFSVESANRRLQSADHVAETGDYEAALLLLWTAAEAVLRDQLRRHTGDSLPGTSRLPKLAYSMGLIETRDVAIAEWMTKIRNEVVHGRSESSVSQVDYDRARDFVIRLMAGDRERELLAS